VSDVESARFASIWLQIGDLLLGSGDGIGTGDEAAPVTDVNELPSRKRRSKRGGPSTRVGGDTGANDSGMPDR